MVKYQCPGCNIVMHYEDDNEVYECTHCDITYLGDLDGDPRNFEFLLKDEVIANGTFDHCCRVYKLKVFL